MFAIYIMVLNQDGDYIFRLESYMQNDAVKKSWYTWYMSCTYMLYAWFLFD